MRPILTAMIALSLSYPAFAQEHSHDMRACAAQALLPAGMSDWGGATAVGTASSAEHAVHARLTLGKGYEATLAKKADVTFSVAPEQPGGSVSYSGLFAFTVAEAGNYTVALGTAPWIDVLEDGKALEPLKFGHGPECTTIRKMVTYPLKAGLHVLQVAGNGASKLKLMVAKAS